MKYSVLYEAVLLESLNQNDEIKDTLNVLFLMNMNSGNTIIPMSKIKSFIKQKFDITVDTNTIKKLLADMDSVSDYTDNEVSLVSEDEDSEDEDKKAVAEMSAKSGSEEMDSLDTAGLSESTDENLHTQVQESDNVDLMFQLFSGIICTKEMAHVMHLNAVSGGEHLMLEKIYDILDGMIDELGEVYFMSRNIKIPDPLKNSDTIVKNGLEANLYNLIDLGQTICTSDVFDDGIKSMVSDYMKDFQRCLGFLRQAKHDAEDIETVDLDI